MALTGTKESGILIDTGLATATGVDVTPDLITKERSALKWLVRAVSTEAFKLQVQATADGTDFYPVKQVASAAIVVAGVAGYDNAAELEATVGYREKIVYYNDSGNTADYVIEWRLFE